MSIRLFESYNTKTYRGLYTKTCKPVKEYKVRSLKENQERFKGKYEGEVVNRWYNTKNIEEKW